MPTHLPVIDDDRPITSLLRWALRFAGHTVRVARDYPCIKLEPGGMPRLIRTPGGASRVPGE